MTIDFEHIQAAHCETGVTRNLLKNAGVEKITEPLAFGIGAGLFFLYVPLVKVNNGPAIAFRTLPGHIFKKTCNALGIDITREKFKSKDKAQLFLDDRLKEGHAVGCQVGVYYLPYFPKEYRFHFNAHNLIVYGKEADRYMISDPIMEHPVTLSAYELERVRFAKGALAPGGQLYFPKNRQAVADKAIKDGIKAGIRKNSSDMLHIPLFVTGVKGIRYLGNRIKKWHDKMGLEKSGLYLAQLVRMQEEIGTGGGGFRFLYGAFLQEAYAYHPNDQLIEISHSFTKAGDLWRSSAVQAAGICKGRLNSQEEFNKMGDYLLEIAEVEKKAFESLSKLKWNS